jgi:hypothetical protein
MRRLLSELSQHPDDAGELLAYLLQQPPEASFQSTAARLIMRMGTPEAPPQSAKPAGKRRLN